MINDGTFINNEFNDVYLVTTVSPIPLEAFALQVDICFIYKLLFHLFQLSETIRHVSHRHCIMA